MYGNTGQGVLDVDTTAVTTTGTSEETIQSYSLPAGALKRNGQSLRVRAWGTTAANGNDKTVKLTFGATTLVSTGALAANAKDWYLEAIVVRTGAATQEAIANGQFNGAIVVTDRTAPAETLADAITIATKVTDATALGGTLMKGWMVEMLSDA